MESKQPPGDRIRPPDEAPSDSSVSGLYPRASARFYLGGIVLVLILVSVASAFEVNKYRDSIVLATLLLLLLLFYRLLASFRCTRLVRLLTLFGAVAVVLGQALNTSEEFAALNAVPILGAESAWNSLLDGLFGRTGVVAMFAALILAVIEMSTARDHLEAEVAERREAQRLLALHRDNLEVLVSERTAELEASQRALLAQERLAVLGEIMAAVSHEIRNPVGTVRSSLYTLKTSIERGDLERVARAIERAERNIIRCDRIIEELLDLSRARDIEPRDTPLDEWLGGILKAARLPDDVFCETDFQADVAVSLDREKMRRALLNLISNSVQSFEETGGREHRLIVSSVRDGSVCKIRISDTGPGMSNEVLGRLGTPLFSTRAFGVGLGIPVVQETIRGHGGDISYESEVGKGTTVEILLPVKPTGAAV